MGTSTRPFGSGDRSGHDASPFYDRFPKPKVSSDSTVNRIAGVESPLLVHGDSRAMSKLPDNSIALVVTSPPYFVGKEYEAAVGEGAVPASYRDYLVMLRDVFAECLRVLEPGGRMAVNVANLGRKPYRSLSGDLARILEDELKMLQRGEIIWQKAKGANGSNAWGSWCSPSNPVLRDITERIVTASKGRFDRAITRDKREKAGLPHKPTISPEEFMAATLDIWEIPPESASRIGHPAPFPVALPERLIQLHTYEGDWVLDPFMGSGSTLIAALRTKRRAIGYDTDAGYVELAKQRIADEAGR